MLDGVDEVLDGDEIEVDQVPVDANLVAAIEALQFAMEDSYSIYKLDLTFATKRILLTILTLLRCVICQVP